jgi:hypothetical protein
VEESVDDPLSIEGKTTKSENIVIEVKEEGIDIVVNEVEGNVNEVEGNVNEVEGNINEVVGNVVGQGNINYEALQNLSVDEALAFFSS